MVTRSLALSVLLSLSTVGCVVHTHEMPDASMTSTTRATNATAPATNHHDPRFRVSDEIYDRCQLATKAEMDIGQATAWCFNSGPLNDKRIRVMGDRAEVNVARDRLIANGVGADRIVPIYNQGPATIDLVQASLGKRNR